MEEFTHTMLSSVDVNSAQHKLHVLCIFALEHRRLQAAGSLLPDLLELYHWIHNELAYLVTYEDARRLTIQEVIERENEKYGGCELIQLYERVRGNVYIVMCIVSSNIASTFSDGYNAYVEVVGHYNEADTDAGVKGKEGANKIKDATKFIDLLSAKTDDEQLESRDLLYLIINDIVRAAIWYYSKQWTAN